MLTAILIETAVICFCLGGVFCMYIHRMDENSSRRYKEKMNKIIRNRSNPSSDRHQGYEPCCIFDEDSKNILCTRDGKCGMRKKGDNPSNDSRNIDNRSERGELKSSVESIREGGHNNERKTNKEQDAEVESRSRIFRSRRKQRGLEGDLDESCCPICDEDTKDIFCRKDGKCGMKKKDEDNDNDSKTEKQSEHIELKDPDIDSDTRKLSGEINEHDSISDEDSDLECPEICRTRREYKRNGRTEEEEEYLSQTLNDLECPDLCKSKKHKRNENINEGDEVHRAIECPKICKSEKDQKINELIDDKIENDAEVDESDAVRNDIEKKRKRKSKAKHK